MKAIKKILFFVSLFAIYIIFKEFISLYVDIKAIHEYAGYTFLLLVIMFFLYFVIIPIYKIVRIQQNHGPVKTLDEEKKLIEYRIEKFRNNEYLQSSGFEITKISNTKEDYNKIIKHLDKQVDLLRKTSVSQLFYSTAIAQNGFLDAILILSASISHIKEIFILYHGRVSNRDLLTIGKNLYYSIAIGGSEVAEYATEEIISKLSSEGLKSIPFLDKIITSIVDGFINATLLTRISYLTENYCKLTYIKSDKDLYPSSKFVLNSAKNITADIIDQIRKGLIKISKDKSKNFFMNALNPGGYIIGKIIDKAANIDDEKKAIYKDIGRMTGNPVLFGIEMLVSSIKKK